MNKSIELKVAYLMNAVIFFISFAVFLYCLMKSIETNYYVPVVAFLLGHIIGMFRQEAFHILKKAQENQKG